MKDISISQSGNTAGMMGGSSISVLGTDILALVLDFLFYEIIPRDFYSLAFVHRSFQEGIKRFRGRSQTFHYGRNPGSNTGRLTRQRIRDILESPKESSILSNIRNITITSDSESDNGEVWGLPCLASLGYHSKWVELLNLIATIPKLHTLVFKAHEPMPAFLIDRLERYHPRARLEIQDWTRHSDDTDHNDPCEIALSKSINLRSIHADLWISNSMYDLRTPALMRIIALAPNLDEVKIRGEPYSTRGFAAEEKHSREAYFGLEHFPKKSLRSVQLLGTDYLTVLGRSADFGSVESLHIDRGQCGQTMLHGLHPILLMSISFNSLRHLTAEFPVMSRESINVIYVGRMEKFILNCRRLESLEILESTQHSMDPQRIIKYHGPVLRRLDILDNTNSLIEGPACSASVLDSIRNFCPQLESIGINAHPSTDGSFDTVSLSMIAGIATLQVVRLRCSFPFVLNRSFDLDEGSTESYGAKFRSSNGDWIANVWSFIQTRRKENGFSPIGAVHLAYPEWVRTSLGPRSLALEIIKASERDDRPDEIMVDAIIPGSKELSRRFLKMPAIFEQG